MQIQGMQEEVNKRRSMALALLKSRRVMVEEGASPDVGGIDRIYEEANKLDGLIVLKDGALSAGKFKIQENAELAPSQVKMMESSEQEINEIVGANLAAMGYESNETSGVAIEKRQRQAAVVIAPIFENLRRSMKVLGEQVIANIQGYWTGEKVLRVTDRMTGAERFVEINHKIQMEDGHYEVKNNIAQGKFDVVVSESPMTDTIREKNIELIIEWVKKSPPEIVPHLLHLAFELSNITNKESLMAKIKPILGIDPTEEDMSPEQIKQKVLMQLQAQQEEAQKKAAMEQKAIELELEHKDLQNQKVAAQIATLLDDSRVKKAQAIVNMRNMVKQNVLPMKKAAGGKK
jgi:hypothetical protein